MNGLHDVGGMHGFGPVAPTPAEPVFKHEAERRMFGLTMGLMAAGWCDGDGFRHAVEKLPPALYAREVFHENWLAACEAQLRERGLLQPGELERWMAGGIEAARVGPPPRLLPELEEEPLPTRFRVGDRVLTRKLNPIGHTRMPRYVRGRLGRVEADRGVFPFSDALAARSGRQPQHLYTVRFEARELWGDEAPPRDCLFIDLFESYLEPAP